MSNNFNGNENNQSNSYRNDGSQNRNIDKNNYGYYQDIDNAGSKNISQRREAQERKYSSSGNAYSNVLKKQENDNKIYKLRIVLTVVLSLLSIGLVVLVVLLVKLAGRNSSNVSGTTDFNMNLPSAISTSTSESPQESVSTPDFMTDTTTPVTTVPPETTAPVTEKDTPIYVPSGNMVDNSFFSDAIFIGDSRTKGLMLSGDIDCDWYATESLHISTALTNKFVSIDGVDYTIKEALSKNSGKYKKVYIGLGVNDLGYAASNFIAYYQNFVSAIKEVCPDADIYAMAVIPVSKERSDKNLYGVTNEKVKEFNQKLADSADEMGVIFLNVAEPFLKSDGSLIDGTGSPDGVHLGAAGYKMQCDYIRSHTEK